MDCSLCNGCQYHFARAMLTCHRFVSSSGDILIHHSCWLMVLTRWDIETGLFYFWFQAQASSLFTNISLYDSHFLSSVISKWGQSLSSCLARNLHWRYRITPYIEQGIAILPWGTKFWENTTNLAYLGQIHWGGSAGSVRTRGHVKSQDDKKVWHVCQLVMATLWCQEVCIARNKIQQKLRKNCSKICEVVYSR